jgi:hypothetical protein
MNFITTIIVQQLIMTIRMVPGTNIPIPVITITRTLRGKVKTIVVPIMFFCSRKRIRRLAGQLKRPMLLF